MTDQEIIQKISQAHQEGRLKMGMALSVSNLAEVLKFQKGPFRCQIIKAYGSTQNFIRLITGLEKKSPTPMYRQNLLAMARRGEQRPTGPVGDYLSRWAHHPNPPEPEILLAIKQISPNWFKNKDEEKNAKIEAYLQQARDGLPRPKSDEVFRNLLETDPIFKEKLKLIDPKWVFTESFFQKKELLSMAKRGCPKPKTNTPMGIILRRYLSPSQNHFDPVFATEIYHANPSWVNEKWVPIILSFKEKVVNSGSRYIIGKNPLRITLLEMMRDGKPRPKVTTSLGKLFQKLTNKKSTRFDEDFYNTTKTHYPDWLLDTVEGRADKIQQKFIEMAKRGDPRPIKRSKDGSALRYNMDKYPEFSAQMTNLAPQWFKNAKREMIQNEILEIIKRGAQRPQRDSIHWKMIKYLESGAGDKQSRDFLDKIKLMVPEWFIKNRQKTEALAEIKHTQFIQDVEKEPQISELIKVKDFGVKDCGKLPSGAVDLLIMSNGKCPRPHQDDFLGHLFDRLLFSQKLNSQTADLMGKLKVQSPEWFCESKKVKQRFILNLAKRDRAPFKNDHPLYIFWSKYKRRKNVFYKQVISISPYWT